MTSENERLQTALVASREEIARLSAAAGAAGMLAPVGVANHGVGMQPPPPVSVNVSLPPSGAPTKGVVGNGRGYGY